MFWVRISICGIEFHPNLYTLDCKLTSSVDGQSMHEKSTTFGMREVEAGEDHIILNGEPIHLHAVPLKTQC